MRSRSHWWLVVAAALLCLVHTATLRSLATHWLDDADMGHGFGVPLVVGWMIWRSSRAGVPIHGSPSRLTLPVAVLAAVLHILGVLAGGLFVSSVAFCLGLIALVLGWGGRPALRRLAFPLGLLVFMLPKLAVLYNQVTLPMQLLATRIAALLLSATGIATTRDGNLLHLPNADLAVVEACNGIRYLLSLAFLLTVWLGLREPRISRRLLLWAALPLVAILGNGLRVASAGWVAEFAPRWRSEAAHEWVGILIFVLCLALLRAFHWVFDRREESAGA